MVACIIGALGSAALAAYAGRHNPSHLLVAIFCAWTMAPFLVVALAAAAARTPPIRAALRVAAPVLAAGSLALYAASAFGYLHAKLGFVFLIGPAASMLAIGIAAAVAAAASRSHER